MNLGLGPCPICDICEPTWSKRGDLKRHILLEHPRTHICMFCLDAKGMSDVFPSQGAYNDHYKHCHSGIIEAHREQLKRKSSAVSAIPNAKKKKSLQCFLCPHIVMEDHARERHLFTVHRFDHCKLCSLMGSSNNVRYHVLEKHKEIICYLCLGSSPVFQSNHKLLVHLYQCHDMISSDGQGIPLKCMECSSTQEDLLAHMVAKHGISFPLQLHSMRKRAPNRKQQRLQLNDDDLFSLKEITGLKNENGSDCFALSALQLLARTDLFERLFPLSQYSRESKHTTNSCLAASCCLLNFLKSYNKGRSFFPKEVVNNYFCFGVRSLPLDVGDFLRLVLRSLCTLEGDGSHCYPLSERHARAEESADKAFQLSLESKFECQTCLRYSVRRTKEYVIHLSGSEAPRSTFKDSLRNYLFHQNCICGVRNEVSPTLRNPELKYLFVEIDRSIQISRTLKDIHLYPLCLEKEFTDGKDLFGGDVFEVYGAVSYLIGEDNGGHYETRFFSPKRWSESTMLTVHELSLKESRMKPDFDSDVVIVALKRVKPAK